MSRRNLIKAVLLVVFLAAVIGIYLSPLRDHLTRAHLREDVALMRSLWFGPVVLIAAYALGCVFVLPATIFVVAAGVVYGWKFGTLYAMTGAMIGATASYFIGRFLGEGVLTKFGKAGKLVERQVAAAGFKTMLLVRLIPGPPFAVWNYGAGVANVRFSDYFFGTLLGTLPAHMIFTYSADALFNGTMTEGDALKRLALVAVLMMALVLLPGFIAKRLKTTKAGNPTA